MSCRGSARCAVPGCACACRKGDRFAACRCCEARLSPAENDARHGFNWVELHRRTGRPFPEDMLGYWETFQRQYLDIIAADLYVERDPFPPELCFGIPEEP